MQESTSSFENLHPLRQIRLALGAMLLPIVLVGAVSTTFRDKMIDALGGDKKVLIGMAFAAAAVPVVNRVRRTIFTRHNGPRQAPTP